MRGGEEIQALRRSLGLDDRAQEEVRRAGARLASEIDGWVERFYVRLVEDPVAMRILDDEGRIVRLKRSLAAWFAELFALPLDEAYQRAREQIGRTHVRIGLPQHLMVTAMHGVRADVLRSVAETWHDDLPAARRAADALSKVLDLELALMLGAYRRRSTELRRRAEQALVATHLEGGLARARREAVDAARCYAALASRAVDDPARDAWTARLRSVLDGLREDAPPPEVPEPVAVVDLRETCERALAEVSVPPQTSLELGVEPSGLRAALRAESLEFALQDLVQQAVNRATGGRVEVRAYGDGDDVRIEVVDSGAGWDEVVRDRASIESVALTHAERVARLHDGTLEVFPRASAGGGVRLRLRGAARARGD